jgi:hypothetical protein
MFVNKSLVILDSIHVSLLQVAWLTYMQIFTIGGLQMPIEKVNMYVGYSCPIMGIDSFGMHTINYFMELQILSNLGVVCCKSLFYCCTFTNNTKLLGQKVNFHPK